MCQTLVDTREGLKAGLTFGQVLAHRKPTSMLIPHLQPHPHPPTPHTHTDNAQDVARFNTAPGLDTMSQFNEVSAPSLAEVPSPVRAQSNVVSWKTMDDLLQCLGERVHTFAPHMKAVYDCDWDVMMFEVVTMATWARPW